MICPKCKNPIEDNAVVCEWCGTSFLSLKENGDRYIVQALRSDTSGGRIKLTHIHNGLYIVVKNRIRVFELIVNGMVYAECKSVIALGNVFAETYIENTLIKATMSPWTGGVKLFINGKQVAKRIEYGCYIATCVYRTYECPELWTLRRFRDNVLENSLLGKFFIRIYYSMSPAFVKWFGHKRWFCSLWKPFLDKLVEMLQHSGIDSTPYIDK